MTDRTELVLGADAMPSVQTPVTVEQMMLMALQTDKVDALERLIALKREEDDRALSRAFNLAMIKCQHALEPVRRTGYNSDSKRWYVKVEELHAKAMPVIRAHGFTLSFGTDDSPQPDHMRVVCDCLHDSGYLRRYRLDLAVDDRGQKGGLSKTKVEGELSSITRGEKRLTLMIFNIPIESRDIAPGAEEPITAQQAADLRAMLSEYGRNEAGFCRFMGIGSVEELPASKHAAAIQKIKDVAGAK